MPVVFYLLFLVAGTYKADSRLDFITNVVDPTAFFALLAAVCILRQVFVNKEHFPVPDIKLLLPFYLILVVGLASLIYTEAPLYGTNKYLKFAFFNTIALVGPYYLIRNSKDLSVFFAGLVLLSTAMIAEVFRNGVTPSAAGFVTAFGSNYLALARIIGGALLINIFFLVVGSTRTPYRLIGIALLPFMLFGLLVAGGKGPVFAVVIALSSIVGFILVKFFAPASRLGSVSIFEKRILVCVVLFSIAGVAFIVQYSEYFMNLFYRLDVLKSEGGDSALERVRRYKLALSVIGDYRYFFTGLGMGGFSTHYSGLDAARGDYPHNIFLEIFSELGVVAFASLVALLTFAFRSAYRTLQKPLHSDKVAGFTTLALLIFMLFNASVSGDMSDNRELFGVMGIAFSLQAWRSVVGDIGAVS